MPMEPPPRIVNKFDKIWRDWLFFFWQFVFKHTGGSIPTPPATGTSWNAHGNTATGASASPLKVEDASFLIEGSTPASPIGLVPSTGVGTRFMYVGAKGAIRSGIIIAGATSTDWDEANIGNGTTVLGTGGVVTQTYATSLGSANDVTGAGNSCAAVGSSNIVGQGSGSLALGAGNKVTALVNTFSVFAIGGANEIFTSFACTAVGNSNKINGSLNAAVVGINNGLTSAQIGLIVGSGNDIVGISSASVVGNYLKPTAIGAFIVGSGVSVSDRFGNNVANSMMLGANIGAADDATITLVDKKCGIQNEAPLSTMDIGGSVGFKYENVSPNHLDVIDVGATEQYTYRIDMGNITGSLEYAIAELPDLGTTTVDRRIYYFKVTDKDLTANSGAKLRIQPGASDSVELYISGSGPTGYVVGSNGYAQFGIGDAVTLIGNNDDKIWWII